MIKMRCLKDAKYKVGINLKAYNHYEDFKVIKCNANDMTGCFEDNTFDIVLCNAIFEHDRFFWKSLSEIRRVIKPGGGFILGVPGFCDEIDTWQTTNKKAINKIKSIGLPNATVTYKVHRNNADYWRFGTDAYKEVLMAGFKLGTCQVVLVPPRIIGYGTKL
jgi:ubiquinone/menaquinone biosynthesis C-methylase UbiE